VDALNELNDEQIETETKMEIANAILGEATEFLTLADRRLTWIDLHGGETQSDSGLIAWPMPVYGLELNTTGLEVVLKQWTRAGLTSEHGPVLVQRLRRLAYALGLYRASHHVGDLAYFAYAVGHAREEVAITLRELAGELRAEITR